MEVPAACIQPLEVIVLEARGGDAEESCLKLEKGTGDADCRYFCSALRSSRRGAAA